MDFIPSRWARLQLIFNEPGMAVLVRSDQQHRIFEMPDGRSIVIGDLFASSALPAALRNSRNIGEGAAFLLSAGWGRYVSLFWSAESLDAALLRDPSGAMPAYVAEHDGVRLISSAIPRWLLERLGRKVKVNLQRLAAAVAHPPVASFQSLMECVEIVPAGGLFHFSGPLAAHAQLWKPARFATQAQPSCVSAAARDLRGVVERACRTLLSEQGRVVLELSGGLDSAIVLGAVASHAHSPIVSCANFATSFVEGDEREHARAAAAKWNAPLVELMACERDADLARLTQIAQPVEPLLFGLDLAVEVAMTNLAADLDVTAIATGQGGDAVFFQRPTSAVAIDAYLDGGWRALYSQAAFDAARRAHCSIWRVWRDMLLHKWRGPAAQSQFDGGVLSRTTLAIIEGGLPVHPWLEGDETLPPAKRMQIEALCNGQIFYGPSLRSAARTLIHPLLAQPVLEHCLAIPTYMLARGTADRALARAAFEDMLPQSIARRRGKGEASNYYGRLVFENLDFLRGYLIDGTLVAHGILDPDALDNLLTEDMLIWSDRARLPIIYAGFEAWARHWLA
ncbi:asparagine synthase C-terminal domain-containing protein [Allosphingosinicella vermicomposti]|uniref:asparagine synthase-related protein n=1 Tax=Allosphingosinicella vermicomposti TaxID=614671 RepID=UPI00131A4FC0|nr:asparagine synthase C-terminal domain-containing protein [Allosphingosinicella vermicomposti]